MNKTVLGVDIGFDTLKLVGLTKTGRNYRLVGLNAATVPVDSWQPDALRNIDELATVIQTAARTAKPLPINAEQAVIALPESVIFSSTFTIPEMPAKELQQAIPFEVADKLSINLQDTYLDYELSTGQCQPVTASLSQQEVNASKDITGSPSVKSSARLKLLTVFAVAAKQTLVNSVIELCHQAKLDLRSLDIKPGAIVRAVVKIGDSTPRLVIDLGANNTGVVVAEGRSLRLISTVPIGTKLTTGHTDNPKTGLKQRGAEIFDEIVHLTKFFENRLCPGRKITEIILTGGGSNIPGVTELFGEETGLPATLGDPFALIEVGHYPLSADVARTFTDAVGLAMAS